MVLAWIVLLNGGFVWRFFTLRSKRLHALEILLLWSLCSLLFQNYSAIQTMNYRSAIVPHNLPLELAHLLNRIVLYPVAFLLFLNAFERQAGFLRRLAVYAASVGFLTVLEWLSDWLGIFVHVYAKVWWSLLFWALCFLVLLGIDTVFRKMLISGK